MGELQKSGLLMEGEVSIQPSDAEQPFVYRGFQMVQEERLRELPAADIERMSKNGMLPLIFAHPFSMQLMREIFAKQVEQGKWPKPTEEAEVAAEPAGNA